MRSKTESTERAKQRSQRDRETQTQTHESQTLHTHTHSLSLNTHARKHTNNHTKNITQTHTFTQQSQSRHTHTIRHTSTHTLSLALWVSLFPLLARARFLAWLVRPWRARTRRRARGAARVGGWTAEAEVDGRRARSLSRQTLALRSRSSQKVNTRVSDSYP